MSDEIKSRAGRERPPGALAAYTASVAFLPVHSASALVQMLLEDTSDKELLALGVDSAFNLYNEAGAGFARDVARIFHEKSPELSRNLEGGAN